MRRCYNRRDFRPSSRATTALTNLLGEPHIAIAGHSKKSSRIRRIAEPASGPTTPLRKDEL